MTRINLFLPPLDEHLLAARREYPRINNVTLLKLLQGDLSRFDSLPTVYTVQTADNPKGGRGHMLFFANKLGFVHDQYQQVLAECEKRGFTGGKYANTSNFNHVVPKRWHVSKDKCLEFWNDYQPTPEAIALNKKRMIERIPAKPHYHGKLITYVQAVELINNSAIV